MNKNFLRIIFTILGVTLSGISVGFFKISNFGTDPFQCLMSGLYNLIPINFGMLYVIVNVILLILILILDKHFIGLGTIMNLFLVGYVVDFSHNLLMQNFPINNIYLKIIYMLIGFVGLCFGSSLYFTADMGVSTYDAISLHLANKKIAPFKYCRIGSDFICVLLGVIMGGVAGIGTIITAFFMGPLIQYFNNTIAIPILNKYN